MYSFSFPNVFGRSMFSKEYADIEHDEIHVYKIFSSLKHIGHHPFIGVVYYQPVLVITINRTYPWSCMTLIFCNASFLKTLG
jgi:hypothetical protein